MNEKTKEEYLKLADHFIKTRLRGDQPTLKRVSKALTDCAGEYRPAYWRRLRIALALHQEANGYRDNSDVIRTIKNPVTTSGDLDAIKKKEYRVKRVSEADADKIKRAVSHDPLLSAAVYMSREFGLRPAELFSLSCEDGVLRVKGAKKRKDRGADRDILVTGMQKFAVMTAVQTLNDHSDVTVKALQDRLRTHCKKMWPKRKAVPSFYSFRHQLGSDLKADTGYSREQVAYLMGHQSTASVDQYGNRKTASGRDRKIYPADSADLSQIREKHTDMSEKNSRFSDDAKSNNNQRFNVSNGLESERQQELREEWGVDQSFDL